MTSPLHDRVQWGATINLLNQFLREEAVFASCQDIFIVGGILSVVGLNPVFFFPGGYRVSKKDNQLRRSGSDGSLWWPDEKMARRQAAPWE